MSVLMLREGWDVRNVSVIVPLRAYTAKARILPEQTLGRGLRRMTLPGSGVDEQVVVIEHEAFRQLWDEAMREEGLDLERRAVAEVRPEAKVIAVDPERLDLDIAVPQLSRMLVRDTSTLTGLRVEDIRAVRLDLPTELRSDVVDAVGRDLLSGEEVDRAQYVVPLPDDPDALLAWYVRELQHDSRVTAQFAVLAPLVRDYVERRVFGGPVSFDDPLVTRMLCEPAVHETILGALREAVDGVTLVTTAVTDEAKPLLLSATRPFLWSRETAAVARSIFPLQPCDSGYEVAFCAFLDRCTDVTAFAKLAQEVRFSLEYRAEGGRLAYYYPDFVVRLGSGDHLVVETKGLADLDVPRKDERATRWAVDASVTSGVRWRYVRVHQELFDAHVSKLDSMASLVHTIYARRREDYLRGAPTPRRRSREEVLANMEEISRRMEGVTGIDEELRRFRDDPRG